MIEFNKETHILDNRDLLDIIKSKGLEVQKRVYEYLEAALDNDLFKALESNKRTLAISCYGEPHEADATLNLSAYFYDNARKLSEGYTWIDVKEKLDTFLCQNVDSKYSHMIYNAVPYAVAFLTGQRIYQNRRSSTIDPVQILADGSKKYWGKEDGKEITNPENFTITRTVIDNEQFDVAIVISITYAIENAVKMTLANSKTNIGKIIHFQLDQTGSDSVRSGSHAWLLAQSIDKVVRNRSEKEKEGCLHIFVSSPISIMYHLGKLSKMYGEIQLYEFDPVTRSYFKSVHFPLENE